MTSITMHGESSFTAALHAWSHSWLKQHEALCIVIRGRPWRDEFDSSGARHVSKLGTFLLVSMVCAWSDDLPSRKRALYVGRGDVLDDWQVKETCPGRA